MASQGVAASSRLAQMQLKFQQKQIQERELRRIEMTGERSDSIETTEPSKKFGNGKVRQMFDERRRGAGIDRSNPLKPLMTTSKSSTTTNSTSSTATIRNSGAAAVRRQPAAAGMQTNGRRNLASSETLAQSRSSSKNSLDITLNGNLKRNQRKTNEYNTSPGDEELFSKGLSSLSLGEQSMPPPEFGDRNNNSNNQKSDFTRVPSSNSIKLKPVLTKKSTLSSSSRTFSNPTTSPLASPTKSSRNETDSSALRKTHTSTVKTSQKSSMQTMSFVKMGEKPMSQAGPPPAGMATCRICHRNFNADRLEKHEQACQKMASSKRKIFDASKARVKGTEAEKYLKKPIRSGTNTRASMTYTSTAAATGMSLPANSGLKKNNWRKKHEEFIAAIRAAKQVKIHLAKGGKLSDLPPPPPSENPDYVQCPHCSRRFNEAAAERHIPKCATMLHNKPKPAAVNKRKA